MSILTCMCTVLFPGPLALNRSSPPPSGWSRRRARTACTRVPPWPPSCRRLLFRSQGLTPKPHRHTDGLFLTCLKTASRPATPLIHEIDTPVLKREKTLAMYIFLYAAKTKFTGSFDG